MIKNDYYKNYFLSLASSQTVDPTQVASNNTYACAGALIIEREIYSVT